VAAASELRANPSFARPRLSRSQSEQASRPQLGAPSYWLGACRSPAERSAVDTYSAGASPLGVCEIFSRVFCY
jgi:hypothetical protein